MWQRILYPLSRGKHNVIACYGLRGTAEGDGATSIVCFQSRKLLLETRDVLSDVN